MSWRTGCKACALTESLAHSRTASTSRSASDLHYSLRPPSSRALAARHASSVAKKSSSGDAGAHRSALSRYQKDMNPTASSIYPESRAADRRHPHAPPLFHHFQRRSADSGNRTTSQPTSSEAYILRNVSTDPELKQLYTALGRAADTGDAVQATKLCQLIKERKQHMPSPSRQVAFEPQEKVVFLAVMRALAHHGLLDEVEAVYADMLSFGFEQCIDSLNHMLQAAVISGDDSAISATLDSILRLSSSPTSSSERSQELANILFNDPDSTTTQSASIRLDGPSLPAQRMRNWNATTFAHMIDSAYQDHNLEYALLLLSMCYRMQLSLPHESLVRVIRVCLHCEEFRTAIELAQQIEQGGLAYRAFPSQSEQPALLSTVRSLASEAQSGQVARRLAPSMWMLILRACAEGGYLPGVELAWSKAVAQGLLVPDDGLLHLILALAAKEGSIQMAQTCLRHVEPNFCVKGTNDPPLSPTLPSARRPSAPTRGQKIEEWHLAPLFEAQCSARDYPAALRTIREYHRRGFQINGRTTSRISTSIYPDAASLKLARDALQETATDIAIGTHRAVVNAVLTAAIWLGDLAQALEIYRAIPSYHGYPVPDDSGSTRGPRTVIIPDLETMHALLSGCIDAADYDTGVQLLKDLNQHKMRPNAVTFERMIVLCLTQTNYEDAFGFVEEAKEKGIPPSRKSYEALVRKCFREKDHRYESVLADMSEQGYRPNAKLLYELGMDPAEFQHKPNRR